MTSYLDRLNLKPFEKRLVVGVAALLFIVLNAVFVFPHFSDMGQVKFRMAKAQRTLASYRDATNQMPGYQAKVDAIQNEENFNVPPEDQSMQFQRVIQTEQAKSGVMVSGNSPIVTRTNSPFFLEQSQMISVGAKEDQLVDFLYNLGSGNSMIRVRGLTLRPDAPRQQLNAGVTVVASFQKKAPARATAQTGSARAPASTKSVPPTVKTATPAPKAVTPAPKAVPAAKPPSGPNPKTPTPNSKPS